MSHSSRSLVSLFLFSFFMKYGLLYKRDKSVVQYRSFQYSGSVPVLRKGWTNKGDKTEKENIARKIKGEKERKILSVKDSQV